MSDHPGFSSDPAEERRRRATGVWGGYLVFALFLLFLIVFDAQAIRQHQWGSVAGITVFTLLFLIVPTGGAIWLRRAFRDRNPPGPQDEPAEPQDEPDEPSSRTGPDQP